MARDWLNEKHPVYEAWTKDHSLPASTGGTAGPGEVGPWLRNEIRLRGGDEVLQYLRRFQWETEKGEHFRDRKREATYINFPDLFATAMLGHLMREAPSIDQGLSFGGLGPVRRERGTSPTRAELAYYNVDGVGNDGSQWDNWWLGVARRAFATGHRWIFVEAPAEAPRTEEDEIRGLRPYLVEFSPLSVPNWHYDRGQLQFAVVTTSTRSPRVESGRLEGGDFEEGKLLLVRAGFDGLGSEYAGGGWWMYDGDGEPVKRGGDPLDGTWEKTEGEIPLFPLYYERDNGSRDLPSMSRPGTTELGQVAVAYMNLASAADWDFFDAASSITWLLGVTREAYELAMAKISEGSRFPPLPPGVDGTVPDVHDGSQGAVTAEVARSVLERKREVARELALREATSTPDSSGRSKQVGFEEQKAPRLALLASELEQAQNTAIHFLERRFGIARPSGSVSWPREFDLASLIDEIREFFELEQLTGYTSRTLAGKGMALAAEQKGLVTDEDEFEVVRREYEESAGAPGDAAAQAAAQDDEIDQALLAGTAATAARATA